MGYPIHNYGSDAIRGGVQSWVQGKAQKQAAMLKAIMETAPYMSDFTAGSPAYEKVKDAFGPQVTQAVAAQAAAKKNQMEVKARVDAFDMGNKYLSGLESIDKLMGKKAYSTPLFEGMAKAASESFKKAGINFNYNNLLSYKENVDKLNEASIDSINKVMGTITPGNADVTQLKNLDIALKKYKQVPGFNKEFLGAAEALYEREAKIVAEKEKEKRAANEWDRRQRAKGPTKEGILGNIYQNMIDGVPLNDGQKKILEETAKGQGMTVSEVYERTRARLKAKTDEFERQMGRPATSDEKRRLFVADPYGFLAPSETQEEYLQTATNPKTGEKVGLTKEGKWVPIK